MDLNTKNIEMHNNNNKSCEQGRWTREEHELFLQGMAIFGKNWKQVQQLIKTRTAAQIRSHAQKYFQKIAKATNDHSLYSSQSSIGEDAYNVLEYLDYVQNNLESASSFLTSGTKFPSCSSHSSSTSFISLISFSSSTSVFESLTLRFSPLISLHIVFSLS